MSTSLKRRAVRVGGWKIARRIVKPIPVLGTAVAVSLAGYEIRKKGLWRGALHVGLDAAPIIGTAKGILEFFTGDLIRDKEDSPSRKL